MPSFVCVIFDTLHNEEILPKRTHIATQVYRGIILKHGIMYACVVEKYLTRLFQLVAKIPVNFR